MTTSALHRLVLVCLCAAATTGPALAMAQTEPEGASVDALQCWRRVDRHTIYVGQSFAMTVTCQVVETELARAVPDLTALEPQALDIAPFEVLDGDRFEDVVDGPYRIVQYRYTLRVIGEDYFGEDIELPPVDITYRIERSVDGGGFLPGRELVYVLPPEPIRLLSLVPRGMADIQSVPLATLGDAERRRFKADMAMLFAVALGVGAIGVLFVGLLRVRRERKAPTADVRAPTAPATVARAALAELTAVRRESQTGWTTDLTSRALAALRVATALALGQAVTERDAEPDEPPRDGELPVRPRRVRRRTTMVSAAVTSRDVTRPELGRFRDSLSALSLAKYGADGEPPSRALVGALEQAIAATRPLPFWLLAPVRYLVELSSTLRARWGHP